MQVDVVSVQDLNRAGATKLSEWITREPGVAFDGNGGPGMGALAIRGVTTGAQTVATVGAYD